MFENFEFYPEFVNLLIILYGVGVLIWYLYKTKDEADRDHFSKRYAKAFSGGAGVAAIIILFLFAYLPLKMLFHTEYFIYFGLPAAFLFTIYVFIGDSALAWHRNNKTSKEILERFNAPEEPDYYFRKAWNRWAYVFYNDDVIAALMRYEVAKFRWDDVKRIKARDLKGDDETRTFINEEGQTQILNEITLTSTDNKKITFTPRIENYRELVKFMEKKFPTLPKDWEHGTYDIMNQDGVVFKK